MPTFSLCLEILLVSWCYRFLIYYGHFSNGGNCLGDSVMHEIFCQPHLTMTFFPIAS